MATTTMYSLINASAEQVVTTSERTEQESKEDQIRVFYTAGEWAKARNKGVLPPEGYFHYAVQRHLIKKLKGSTTERTVTFYPEFIPKGNKTNQGSADLYFVDDDEQIAYFWEVKPGSYLRPDLMSDGKKQLDNYVEHTYYDKSLNSQRCGNTTYPDGKNNIIVGEYSVSKVLKEFKRVDESNQNYFKKINIDDIIEKWSQDKITFDFILDDSEQFIISIAYFPGGLILYWFAEVPNSKLGAPVPELSPFFFYGCSIFYLFVPS